MGKSVVDFSDVGKALRIIVENVGVDGKRVVAREMQEMAVFNFPQAALRFYPTVLRVRTGLLRRNMAGFSERIGEDSWRIGMRVRNVEYARIQHEGGQINRGRPIVPREGRVGRNGRPAALEIGKGSGIYRRRVNNPGFIPATKFLSTPMRREVIPMLERIHEKIGFRP